MRQLRESSVTKGDKKQRVAKQTVEGLSTIPLKYKRIKRRRNYFLVPSWHRYYEVDMKRRRFFLPQAK